MNRWIAFLAGALLWWMASPGLCDVFFFDQPYCCGHGFSLPDEETENLQEITYSCPCELTNLKDWLPRFWEEYGPSRFQSRLEQQNKVFYNAGSDKWTCQSSYNDQVRSVEFTSKKHVVLYEDPYYEGREEQINSINFCVNVGALRNDVSSIRILP